MKKEFIPYQEALALKELGFDEPCFGYYEAYLKNSKIELKIGVNTKTNNKFIIAKANDCCLAPLYQQAFRFFREKYNIKPCFDWHPTEKYRYCIYYSINSYFAKCDFLNYEESELACLKKLIEICQKKK